MFFVVVFPHLRALRIGIVVKVKANGEMLKQKIACVKNVYLFFSIDYINKYFSGARGADNRGEDRAGHARRREDRLRGKGEGSGRTFSNVFNVFTNVLQGNEEPGLPPGDIIIVLDEQKHGTFARQVNFFKFLI